MKSDLDDVCLAGEPARNSVCGDLLCVCAPDTPEARAAREAVDRL